MRAGRGYEDVPVRDRRRGTAFGLTSFVREPDLISFSKEIQHLSQIRLEIWNVVKNRRYC
jgi:hypothetical protein